MAGATITLPQCESPRALCPRALLAQRFPVWPSRVHSQEPLLCEHMAGGVAQSKSRVCCPSEELSDSARDDTQQAAPPLHTGGGLFCLDTERVSRSAPSPGGVVTKLSLSDHIGVVLFVFVVNHVGGGACSICSSVVFRMWMFLTDRPIFLR